MVVLGGPHNKLLCVNTNVKMKHLTVSFYFIQHICYVIQFESALVVGGATDHILIVLRVERCAVCCRSSRS